MSGSNHNSALASEIAYGDEIDLRQVAHVIWQFRVSIMGACVIGALLGIALSWATTRYRSQGLFLTPGVVVGNYKPLESALANKTRLQQFLDLTGTQDSPSGQRLLDIIDNPGALSLAVRPEFAFTDRDAKEFGVRLDQAGIVGLQLAIEESTPSEQSPLRLLSEYVRDAKIMLDLEVNLARSCNENTTRAQELRNAQIADQFEVRQHEIRMQTLREIIKANPQAAQEGSRQVVSLKDGEERFLPPVSQLIALEVAVTNLKIGENVRERDRVATAMRKAYYCQAREMMQQPTTGRSMLEKLPELQKAVTEGQTETGDIVEFVGNELAVQLDKWRSTYIDGMRFVTPPEGAETRVRKLGMRIGLILGCVVGGVVGLLLAFGRSWWRKNREIVVAEDAV